MDFNTPEEDAANGRAFALVDALFDACLPLLIAAVTFGLPLAAFVKWVFRS